MVDQWNKSKDFFIGGDLSQLVRGWAIMGTSLEEREEKMKIVLLLLLNLNRKMGLLKSCKNKWKAEIGPLWWLMTN